MAETEWRAMEDAPRNASWIIVLLPGGKTERAHYAEDLSGSEQPAFRGWFRNEGSYFAQLPEPVSWKPEEVPGGE